MAVALWLALQAASPAPPAGAAPVDFDLADVPEAAPGLRRTCRGADSDEIVVCGQRRRGGGDYPLEAMARIFETKPIVAETGIGGGAVARAFVESVTMPNGEVSNRVMVGIKLPF